MPKLKVQFVSDDDPKVFRVDTGEDVTNRVLKIEILPGRTATVLFRDNEDNIVRDKESPDLQILQEDWEIVEVSGIWRSRRG